MNTHLYVISIFITFLCVSLHYQLVCLSVHCITLVCVILYTCMSLCAFVCLLAAVLATCMSACLRAWLSQYTSTYNICLYVSVSLVIHLHGCPVCLSVSLSVHVFTGPFIVSFNVCLSVSYHSLSLPFCQYTCLSVPARPLSP